MMEKAIDHAIRNHALLAASHAERWINCPPSARLEEAWDEEHPSETSIYAEEGTLAHELAEARLIEWAFGANMSEKLDKIQFSQLYHHEMESYVQDYLDHVIETFLDAKNTTKGAKIFIEKTLNFSHIVPEGFGTGDACIVADNVLHIIDLKYGKGVRVDAKNNPQLMLYAVGALREFDLAFDISEVCLHIVQPRLSHTSVWSISVKDLAKWTEEVVKPVAELAFKGKGVQKAGAHCKFCKVKSCCATLASNSLKLAKLGMPNPHLLTQKQLMEAYKQIPLLIEWANSVNEYVLKEAIEGRVPKGYKLVEGRSQRKWSDESAVREVLIAEGFKETQFMKSKLAGIGDIEKLVGKKNFPDMLGGLVIKPQGAPTLVDDGDPRTAIQSVEQARKDFE